jgi:hypothetical protein
MCLACNSFQLSLVFLHFFSFPDGREVALFTYNHVSFSQLVVVIYYQYRVSLFLSFSSKKMMDQKKHIVGFIGHSIQSSWLHKCVTQEIKQ